MQPELIIHSIHETFSELCHRNPNELLPREAQTQAALYHAARANGHFATLERGYAPIELGSKERCDLVVFDDHHGQDSWIELKHAWSMSGFNPKPNEQLRSWRRDLQKLAQLPILNYRIFVLVGVFDLPIEGLNPPQEPDQPERSLLQRIWELHPPHRVGFGAIPFQWRMLQDLSLGVWVWAWEPHEELAP